MCKAKIFAPTISLLLAVCILLVGCDLPDIIQPGRTEIVGANLPLWDGSMELDIRLDMMLPNNVAVSYGSNVDVSESMAQWDGKATVYFANKFFEQDCRSQCDSSRAAKWWRGNWVQSDTTSPAKTVTKWLERAKTAGVYHTQPVVPADYDDALEALTEKCYRITLRQDKLDWKSLCDFHLDTLFGGEGQLDNFTDIEVTLYFGTRDLLLDGIMVSAEDPVNVWFELTILPVQSEVELSIDLGSRNLPQGSLSEEWEICGAEAEE